MNHELYNTSTRQTTSNENQTIQNNLKVEHENIAINCAALVFKIGSSQVSGLGVERNTVTDD